MRRIIPPFIALCFFLCCLWPGPLPAASDAPAKLTTVYGMLRQSPEGGIVFVSSQEPDVVYLPFDPGAIMGSLLNIEVRLRGEIRDSFTRQGKTYRVVAVADIEPMKDEYGNTAITENASFGLPGSDPVQIHAYHGKTCYLYAHYAVLEILAMNSDGHALRVMTRTAADAPAAVCEDLEGMPLFEIPDGGDFSFAGLSGDTLFIQNGAPSQIHGLMAVNLATKTQTLDATVPPGATVSKGVLRYQQKMADGGVKKVCPAGQTATRPMVLDMKTGKSREVGKTVCWP
jgi:hypothetical protein